MDAIKKPPSTVGGTGGFQNLAGVLDSIATDPPFVGSSCYPPAEEKRFATLAARYALTGHSLLRSQPGEGQAPYYCTRWGYLRPLQGLDSAEQLLEQIAGKK